MHPKDLSIESFTYELPEERIAKFPLAQRDSSKLLVYREGQISEKVFSAIDTVIPEGSLLVFNDTKVIHARIHFRKASGALIEVFCLEPQHAADYGVVFSSTGPVTWKCMVGNAKRWKDEVLEKNVMVNGREVTLYAQKESKQDDVFFIRFWWHDEAVTFGTLLHASGSLPIPPYLNRENEPEDENTYQTIYAAHEGSVAAPTAGLHFTEAVFRKLDERNIVRLHVTLHVGAGTFKPVKAETMLGHTMHEEHISIPLVSLEKLHAHLLTEKPLICVGTTSMRTIESLYWFGAKLVKEPQHEQMTVSQWEPYENETLLSKADALAAITSMLKRTGQDTLHGSTQILIAPGYEMKMTDALITNFHQPGSTLLLLVSALVGERWKAIYDHAMKHDFRFLSYGDSSVLFR